MREAQGDGDVEAALDALVQRLHRSGPGTAPNGRARTPIEDTTPADPPLRRLWGVMTSDGEVEHDDQAMIAHLDERARVAEEDRLRLTREVGELLVRLEVAEIRAAADHGRGDAAPVDGGTGDDAELSALRRQNAALTAELEALRASAPDGADADERLASMQEVVETIRSGREGAERRVAELENTLIAERRNLEMAERESATVRAERDALVETLRNERGAGALSELADLGALRERAVGAIHETDELAANLAASRATVDFLQGRLNAAEDAGTAAEAFAQDTSRELGEAMGDLMAARELIERLEEDLNAELRQRGELEAALAAERALVEEQRAAASVDLSRANEAAEVAALEQAREWAERLNAHAAELQAELELAAQRISAAEAAVQERDDALLLLRGEREALVTDLAVRTTEVDVLRNRLRDEMEAREKTAAERDLYKDEVEYLRGEVLGADAKSKRGRFGRLPERPGKRPSPSNPARPSSLSAAASPPQATTPEELEAALDRRLFGD